MRKFAGIVESLTPPPSNCVWVKGDSLLTCTNGTWNPIVDEEEKKEIYDKLDSKQPKYKDVIYVAERDINAEDIRGIAAGIIDLNGYTLTLDRYPFNMDSFGYRNGNVIFTENYFPPRMPITVVFLENCNVELTISLLLGNIYYIKLKEIKNSHIKFYKKESTSSTLTLYNGPIYNGAIMYFLNTFSYTETDLNNDINSQNSNALLPPTTKAVKEALDKKVDKTDIATVYKYKGSKDTYSALPTSDNTVGDVYNIVNEDAAHNIKAGDNVVWNGTTWDNLSGIMAVDSELSGTSVNPVQNKVVKAALDETLMTISSAFANEDCVSLFSDTKYSEIKSQLGTAPKMIDCRGFKLTLDIDGDSSTIVTILNGLVDVKDVTMTLSISNCMISCSSSSNNVSVNTATNSTISGVTLAGLAYNSAIINCDISGYINNCMVTRCSIIDVSFADTELINCSYGVGLEKTNTLHIISGTVCSGSLEADSIVSYPYDGIKYTLPTASSSVLGGIKVGNNLSISDGVLSVSTDATVTANSTKPVTSGAVSKVITDLGNTYATTTKVSAVEATANTANTTATSALSTANQVNTDLQKLIADLPFYLERQQNGKDWEPLIFYNAGSTDATVTVKRNSASAGKLHWQYISNFDKTKTYSLADLPVEDNYKALSYSSSGTLDSAEIPYKANQAVAVYYVPDDKDNYGFIGIGNNADYARIITTASKLECYGDIMAHIGVMGNNKPELGTSYFKHLFNRCASLIRPPKVPATTLANNCYRGMFQLCTLLTNAPDLPAITLASGCYAYMFNGCKNLVSTKIMAVTSATDAFTSIFSGITTTNGVLKVNKAKTYDISEITVPTGWTVEEVEA